MVPGGSLSQVDFMIPLGALVGHPSKKEERLTVNEKSVQNTMFVNDFGLLGLIWKRAEEFPLGALLGHPAKDDERLTVTEKRVQNIILFNDLGLLGLIWAHVEEFGDS